LAGRIAAILPWGKTPCASALYKPCAQAQNRWQSGGQHVRYMHSGAISFGVGLAVAAYPAAAEVPLVQVVALTHRCTADALRVSDDKGCLRPLHSLPERSGG
jgi:hypothetical protein